ncbi:MAG TPA: folylpolyglutamate synthase/dihydrofolate synthase family protein, partial [Candidatus Omnitrophota bacterium]|nr:folylpolyglutamate synthase/dihydrofolate synthase family protein [Candidatus Omnitrophota bacterium]
MTYQEALQYLESFINYENIPAYPYKESLKLECLKGFLSAIGNPQGSLKCLHVAGSKGKGSTCAFLTYILRQAGYKAGLYTSPHLSDFRERIRILNPKPEILNSKQIPNPKSQIKKLKDFEGMISKKALTDLVVKLRPAIDKYNKASKYGPLSFFEVYTALALVYFREEKVDFAVLETGLGGRLDATNVVSPLACIITPISYEHTQKLGNTLTKIANEKAGIIKNQKSKIKNQKLTVISAPQEKEVIEVIRKKCLETGARLIEVKRAKRNLKIRLAGRHQLVNATVAVRAIEALGILGIKLGVESIRGGLYNTVWPGRCEVISNRPILVLDGAQNIASAAALKKTIRERFRYRKLNLILGISSDKDIQGICHELNPLADRIILTKADSPRAASPTRLAGYFNGEKEVLVTNNVREAGSLAHRLA